MTEGVQLSIELPQSRICSTAPELQTDSGKDGEEENSGVFTETLARIYTGK